MSMWDDDYGNDSDFEDNDYDDLDEEENLIDGVGFADPNGKYALRAATKSNPRNLPCPNCLAENVLTPLDVAAHYVCDRCADAAEAGF